MNIGPTRTAAVFVITAAMLLLPLVANGAEKGKKYPLAGADESTPSVAHYFSWINNTNEGSTEAQTMADLDFFKWMHDEYGMQLRIYAFDAGVIDADTHHQLVAFLAAPAAAESSTAAPAVPEQPWVHPPRKTAPASTSPPKPAEPPPAPVLDDLTRPAPNEKSLAAAVVAPATRPLEPPPQPPPPPDQT